MRPQRSVPCSLTPPCPTDLSVHTHRTPHTVLEHARKATHSNARYTLHTQHTRHRRTVAGTLQQQAPARSRDQNVSMSRRVAPRRPAGPPQRIAQGSLQEHAPCPCPRSRSNGPPHVQLDPVKATRLTPASSHTHTHTHTYARGVRTSPPAGRRLLPTRATLHAASAAPSISTRAHQ